MYKKKTNKKYKQKKNKKKPNKKKKNKQKNKCSWDYAINCTEKEDENET